MRLKGTYVACLVVLLAALAAGCGGRDEPILDGGRSDGVKPVDSTIGPLPDGYGPLWPCTEVGKACNAHDPCAINPVCGADKLCRPGQLQVCNDGLTCTTDTCKGMGLCSFEPATGSCALPVKVGGSADGGVGTTEVRCFTKGQKKPDDPCQICDPEQAGTKWTGANGGSCDDGSTCTKDDYCQAGSCKGTYYGTQCADKYGCTDDLCDGKGGCLGNKLKSDWCLINGVCYKDKMNDPAGSCNTCDVTKSQSVWTPITNTCLIDNKCYKPGDNHPTGTCAECDPTVSTSSWVVKGNDCLIDKTCKKSGDKDSIGCSACDPTKDKYDWTALPNLCKIGGKCYSSGASHPDSCGTCDPTKSATSWTPTATGCAIGVTCYKSAAKEPGGCGLCDPTKSQTAWTKGSGCLATHLWSQSFGGSSSDYPYDVAVDASGNVYITGYFYNSINFGGGTLTANGSSSDIFLASFTPSGKHRWSKAFGGTSYDYGYGVAVDGSGNVTITGYYSGSISFGGSTLTSTSSSSDIFLASFTSAGTHRWSKSFGGTSSDYGYAVATDPTGNVYLTGYFYTSINFGGTTLTANGSSSDLYLASFTSAGAHRWSKAFGTTSYEYAYGLATDSGGNVYMTGYFSTSGLNFGGTALSTNGSSDIFLASFTPAGVHRWSKSFGSTSSDYGYNVATDPAGNVYLTGYFYNSVNFGGGAITSNGSGDAYIASFTSAGAHRWSKGFGGTSSDYGYGVATDASGNVYLAGYFYNDIDFGGGKLTSVGSGDIYAASFTSGGAHRWSRSHGSTSYDYGRRIAADGAGNAYVVGYFYNTVDFGGGPLTSLGSYDIVLLKVGP